MDPDNSDRRLTAHDDPVEVVHHEGGNLPAHGHHDEEVIDEKTVAAYWSDNLKLLGVLLAIWFLASFGAGILFVEPLNTIEIFGMKLGFWFAQQGAIYVFLALIIIYVFAMSRIERRYGVDDED